MIQLFGHSLQKIKDLELAALDEGAGLATVQGNDNVSLDVPVKLTNLVSFFQRMKLRYNVGLGTQDIVTFLGADFVEDMQLKCKIQLSNESIILVDIETLNFIEKQDIALIPETSENYLWECTVITPSQLEHILHLKALSLLHEEMMSYHY
jgi:hypothetical protein